MIPEYMQNLLGLPTVVDICGKEYKAIPLTTKEFLKFQSMNPPSADTPLERKQSMEATSWVIFTTLKKQTPEWDHLSFEKFLEETTGEFVLNMVPLFEKVLEFALQPIKKKE